MTSDSSLGATMVPDLLLCGQCGRASLVLSWSPIYDDATELAAMDDSKTLFVSCKIECPTCGTRIQSTRPMSVGDREKMASA
jgi:hypothetical protein